jgi:orotidine-5'-phosphate decarboxylase
LDQLLVALDVDTGRRALALADLVGDVVGGFKIGHRLFTAEGPSIVRALVERRTRVFLDLKYHDIPNTVATAVAEATELGVWMVNVHASGGARMMRAAADAAKETAARKSVPAPLVIGVTVLTSLNADALAETGVNIPVLEQVLKLATLAQSSGLDGVVASAQETAMIRKHCGETFTIVTPGIRGGFPETPSDDQERTMTPAGAIRAGASYLVVGRPIIAAPDPRAAVAQMAEEIKGEGKREKGKITG